MLDDRIRAVLARLDGEEVIAARESRPLVERSLAVGPEAGALLFALAAAIPGCRALEVGSSLGYSTLWIGAGARLRGGSVTSLELEPEKAARWLENVRDAGLDEIVEVVVGDASASLRSLAGPFDLVLLDAWKDDYEEHFGLLRPLLGPGAVVVADNVGDHSGRLAAYVAARQGDPTLSSLTVPIGNGLEITSILG
jgi:predicted O-methyltransferase YrrM